MDSAGTSGGETNSETSSADGRGSIKSIDNSKKVKYPNHFKGNG